MKSSRPSSFVRALSRLGRWLKHAWLDRIPSAGAERCLPRSLERSRWEASKPAGSVRLDLQLLEGRFSPDDLFGLGLSALQMPLLTPAAILLNGWTAAGPPGAAHIAHAGYADPRQNGLGVASPVALLDRSTAPRAAAAPQTNASAAAPHSPIASAPPASVESSPFDPDWLQAVAAALGDAPAGASGGATGTASGSGGPPASATAPAGATTPTPVAAPSSASNAAFVPNLTDATTPPVLPASSPPSSPPPSSPPPSNPPGGMVLFYSTNTVEAAPIAT